ncbi:MAG TPA: DUF4157 domain-containing protein, partial [Longimicrobium sp.]
MNRKSFTPGGAPPRAAQPSRSRADAARGAGAGMPRFLGGPTTVRMRVHPDLRAHPADRAHERQAEQAADTVRAGGSPGGLAPAVRPPAEASPAHALVRRSLRGVTGGEPLPPETRSRMEERFGHDFSGVRVHTDPASGAVAQALGANALTSG